MPEAASNFAAGVLLAVALAGFVVLKTIDRFLPKFAALMPLSLLVTCLAVALLIGIFINRFK